jgi:dynein heavy chain
MLRNGGVTSCKLVGGCCMLPLMVHAAFCRGLQVEDAITEALENDNLQLQNMSGQKYVQLNPMFLDAVANWQKKLGTVDSVLATWTDVQKKWQALESIFVGSADIRVQLPDDSKRFDVINADYQVGLKTKELHMHMV